MSISKNRVDEFLLAAQVMIENSLFDNIVKTALAAYGFTETKLTEIKKLYEETAALHNAQKKEYGEQVAATSELNDIWETADRQYMKTLKVAGWLLKRMSKRIKLLCCLVTENKAYPAGWSRPRPFTPTSLMIQA